MADRDSVGDVGFAWVGVKAAGEVEEEGSAQLARSERTDEAIVVVGCVLCWTSRTCHVRIVLE
jgi:hypothetical protein